MSTNTQLVVNALQRLQYEVAFGHRSLHSSSFHPTKGEILHMLKRQWLHIKLLVQQQMHTPYFNCTTKMLSLSNLLKSISCSVVLAPKKLFIPSSARSAPPRNVMLFIAVHHTVALCLQPASFICLSLLLFSRYIYPFHY